MIQKFWRCKPLEPGYHRSRIENLCRKAGMGYANILDWPIFGGRMITAGVMGLVKRFRYILVTNALLQMLEPEEIDAVIAHEIGHIKKKHLLFYLLFFVGLYDDLLRHIQCAGIFYCLFRNHLQAHNQHRHRSDHRYHMDIQPGHYHCFSNLFRFIFGYFMRNFERQADTYVYALFDSAGPLISTFKKIAATSGDPSDKPNWHHFSIKDRIDYLVKCEADRTWITRHDNKIKKSIAAYLVGIVLICGIGYNLNFGESGKKLNTHFFEKIIQRELEKTPDNPLLYTTLGDLHFSNKKYTEAIKAYEQSLRLDPDNPYALNNLAWLFATCEVEFYRDPEKALALAKKAAGLKNAPPYTRHPR